jgi:hypothetical protein
MHARVQYPASIEPLVQFIEETDHDEILDKTLAKLRDGVDPKTMLIASSLAVVRSADLPPGHHGGPLHPLAGIHAISRLVDRLEGDDRFLPVLQHVALSNRHLHDPMTSPFQLLEFDPLGPAGSKMSRISDLAQDGAGDVVTSDGIQAVKDSFLKACSRGEALKADHLFLWLWENVSEIEAFDLLMSVALPKNILDDHYFIFPGYLWRGIESIGKEHMKVLFRPAVRYVARAPVQKSIPEIDALIDEYDLLERVLRQRTGDDETEKIGALGEAIGLVHEYTDIPEMIAKALVDGLSLEGAGEALSVGAARLFLRSLTGNPMDVHLHTSANLRRYLVRLDGFSIRNKLLALMLWHTGPEVRNTQYRQQPTPQPEPAAVAALPHRSQEELLAAIKHSIYTQPPTDWSKVSNLGTLRAVPEVRHSVNLAQQYVNLRYDPQALIKCLAEIVCHDSFTEMHAFKHHQAVIEEFNNTREPWRSMHLVCGVMAAAISFGKNMTVYEDALDLMHAA